MIDFKPLTTTQRARLWSVCAKRFDQLSIIVDFKHKCVSVDAIKKDAMVASATTQTLDEALWRIRRQS